MVPTIKAKISRPCFSLSLAHAVIKTLEKNGKFLLRGLICFELFEEARVQVSCHVISNFLLTKRNLSNTGKVDYILARKFKVADFSKLFEKLT